jgi:hypothetical protein
LPDMPQWASVWFWLRFVREPRDMTPLPQQGINLEAMTLSRYEELEAEWLRSGAPVASAQQVVMAMGAVAPERNPLLDDGIPF